MFTLTGMTSTGRWQVTLERLLPPRRRGGRGGAGAVQLALYPRECQPFNEPPEPTTRWEPYSRHAHLHPPFAAARRGGGSHSVLGLRLRPASRPFHTRCGLGRPDTRRGGPVDPAGP